MQFEYEKNVGDYEAVVRGVMGAAGLALAIGSRNPLWLLLSVAGFGTAFTRYCPLSALMGVNTYYGEGHLPSGERPATTPTLH